MNRSILAGAIVLLSSCGRESATLNRPPAVSSILGLFFTNPVVGLAEQHRSRQVHGFLRQLVTDPDFGKVVNDIVVEFGNSLYQYEMDQYIAGEDVPIDTLRLAWRNTTQFLVWDSPLYEEFFATVRESNRNRPARQRVRVLLGDPPIDWPRVHTAAEYRAFAERDSAFARVVEDEVLKKHRKALLVIGGGHLQKSRPMELVGLHQGVMELLAEWQPGATSVVWTMPPNDSLARAFGFNDSVPAFQQVVGGPSQDRKFGDLFGRGIMIRARVADTMAWVPMGQIEWPPLASIVDALLYLGSDTTTVDAEPATYQDSAYVAELRRRAAILTEVYGFDFLPQLEAVTAGHVDR